MINECSISVIVSAYNVEKYIDRCVKSILNQSFCNFELIIVDDGSSDATALKADEFSELDHRVSVIHKKNGGLTSARKAGFEIAKGEFICFLDADDYIEKDYLKELYEAMEPDVDIVISSYYVDVDGISHKKLLGDRIISRDMFREKFILPAVYFLPDQDENAYPDFVWLRLYRKSVIVEECFVSERVCYTEDLFFQFNALMRARRVRIISLPLYHYVVTSQSLTLRFRENKWQMVKKRYDMVVDFCEANKVEVCQQRFDGLKLISIVGCVHNAKLSGDREWFIAECKKIQRDYKEFFARKLSVKSSQKQRMIYFLVKYGYYSLLYTIIR